MTDQSFQYSFTTSKTQSEAFSFLADPRNWWVGLFGETIEGKSNAINDEFSFRAGDGVHYSNQRLIEFLPAEKITWAVTESNLSFLQNSNEWAGTKIGFEIWQEAGRVQVRFTHQGLVPAIECYGSCSHAWAQYMKNLEARLN